MIDEKKLIKDIEELKIRYDFLYDNKDRIKIDDTVKRAIDILFGDITKTIDKQPKVGEWIPCSERLPEEDGDYLIAWFHANKLAKSWQEGKHYYEIGEYSPEEGWISDFEQCPEGYEVVAWQPLPALWEGEE